MPYDDWKLETPEDEEERHAYETQAWTRRLYGRRAHWQPDPDESRDEAQAERLHDIREECKADYQRTGGDDD